LTARQAGETIGLMATATRNGTAAGPLPDGRNGTLPVPRAAEGRDGQGRFAKGNAGGAGNPYARRSAALKGQLLDAAEVRLPKVIAMLFDRAEGGDMVAIELILRYALGKATPAPDPDRLDLEELLQKLRWPLEAQVVLAGLAVEPVRALEFLAQIAGARRDRPLLPDDEDDDGPEAVGRAVVLAQLREQILQARARAT
jgi:hypothetical protein